MNISVAEVHRRLLDLGYDDAYSTVAGWFNGHRAERFTMDKVKALCAALESDMNTLFGDEVVIMQGKVDVLIGRGVASLPDAQKEAVLALIESMLPDRKLRQASETP